MKFHYDENGQAGTGQFWQMESALVLFLIPRRSFQQWRWIFISWSLSNLEKKKHGRLYLEHMTNDLNLITMTTNLVNLVCMQWKASRNVCGRGKTRGNWEEGKSVFLPSSDLSSFCVWLPAIDRCVTHITTTIIFLILYRQQSFTMKKKQLLIT